MIFAIIIKRGDAIYCNCLFFRHKIIIAFLLASFENTKIAIGVTMHDKTVTLVQNEAAKPAQGHWNKQIS